MDVTNDGCMRVRGLVGGSPEMQRRFGRPVEFEHPLFLCPIRRMEDSLRCRELVTAGPVAVEIGFGKGSFLAQLALSRPQWRIIGFEVQLRWCRRAAEKLERIGVKNVLLVLGDARVLIPELFAPRSIHSLFLMFPDPWWKKKHFKRRVLNPEFFATLSPLLAKRALVAIRSDVPLVLEMAERALLPEAGFERLSAPPLELPETDREKVCRSRLIPVYEQYYRFVPQEDADEG